MHTWSSSIESLGSLYRQPERSGSLKIVWLVFVSAVSVLGFISEYLYNGDCTLRRCRINWVSSFPCYKSPTILKDFLFHSGSSHTFYARSPLSPGFFLPLVHLHHCYLVHISRSRRWPKETANVIIIQQIPRSRLRLGARRGRRMRAAPSRLRQRRHPPRQP